MFFICLEIKILLPSKLVLIFIFEKELDKKNVKVINILLKFCVVLSNN